MISIRFKGISIKIFTDLPINYSIITNDREGKLIFDTMLRLKKTISKAQLENEERMTSIDIIIYKEKSLDGNEIFKII